MSVATVCAHCMERHLGQGCMALVEPWSWPKNTDKHEYKGATGS